MPYFELLFLLHMLNFCNVLYQDEPFLQFFWHHFAKHEVPKFFCMKLKLYGLLCGDSLIAFFFLYLFFHLLPFQYNPLYLLVILYLIHEQHIYLLLYNQQLYILHHLWSIYHDHILDLLVLDNINFGLKLLNYFYHLMDLLNLN